jgi:two-component system response regulator ChvI
LLDKGRILVVDDEEDITTFLKIGLEDNGFETVTFNNPQQALSDYKPGFYDLILIDIKMPGMDGFQLYDKLQSIDSNAKVCFMTAYEIYYDALKELFPDSYPSINFIRKPSELKDFVKRISDEINKQIS